MCGDVESGPWSYGLASLGSKLVVNKRIMNPKALTFEQSSDEAGDDPPSEEERLRAPLNISGAVTLDSLLALPLDLNLLGPNGCCRVDCSSPGL